MPELKVADLSAMLNQRVEDVCSRLLPAGKRISGCWVVGGIDGEPGESLKVELAGEHVGKWRDWANDSDHGDLIDLWRLKNGLGMPETLDLVRDYLNVPKTLTTATVRKYAPIPESVQIRRIDETGAVASWLMRERRLDAETIKRFRIDGSRSQNAVVFTSYNPSGEAVNRSYRTLPKEGEKKKVWQEKGAAPCLYGWHALSEAAWKSRSIVLCEGQIDCMTWTQWGFDALSVPNGSGLTWIEYEWENLAAFDTIYLSFDSDGAGAEIVRKTITRLGLHRCLVVNLPHKDANDCLLAGCGREDAAQWIVDAKPPRMERFVRAADIRERIVNAMTLKETAFTLPFLKGQTADDGLYFRPQELTLWTGASGTGKSTFLNYLILHLVCEMNQVYLASLEVKAERSIIKLATTMLHKKPTIDQAVKMGENLGPYMSICDVVGEVSKGELFDQMQFTHRRYGTQHFFIDSLMRIEGLEEDYPAQGKFCNELQAFAKQTDSHIHLVAHARKMTEGHRPSRHDIKGSSLIANNVDNVVAVSRNHEKDEMLKAGSTPSELALLWDTEVSVDKQRETGWTGSIRLLHNRLTGDFSIWKK